MQSYESYKKYNSLAIPIVIAFIVFIGLQIVRFGLVENLDSRYAMENADRTATTLMKMSINPQEFSSFTISGQNTSTAADGTDMSYDMENYKILFASGEPTETKNINTVLRNQISASLASVKRAVSFVDATTETLEIKPGDRIIVAISFLTELDKNGNLDTLFNYVKQGGTVLFASRFETDAAFESFYREFGIESYTQIIETAGISFEANIMPAAKKKEFAAKSFLNSSLIVRLSQNTIVLANTKDKADIDKKDEKFDLPLIWETPMENGKIIIFNGTQLSNKLSRGLIIGLISKLSDGFIYPVIGAKVVFIDDFPSPMMENANRDFAKAYGQSVSSFFNDKWWPALLRTANKADLLYTGAMLESFNENVEPPFEHEKYYSSTSYYGRSLLKNGGELAVQGYNHVPLALEGFLKPESGYLFSWPNINAMRESLTAFRGYVDYFFEDYPMTVYLPPANFLSKEGRQALTESEFNIKVVVPSYTGAAEFNEFIGDYKVAADGVVEFPRITSGFYVDDDTYLNAMNSAAIGVFSHFFQPDDAVEELMKPSASWDNTYKSYNDFMLSINENYDYLTKMTASQAALALVNREKAKFNYTVQDNKYNCKLAVYTEDLSYLMRSEYPLLNAVNCKIETISDNWYSIVPQTTDFSFTVDKIKPLEVSQ